MRRMLSKEANNMDIQIQMARAARTDKGVHAVGNVVSAKLIVEDPDIVAKINQHLPDQIKVWGKKGPLASLLHVYSYEQY